MRVTRPGKRSVALCRDKDEEITLEPLHPRTFGKSSPVTAYWLLNCDGFEVVGRRGALTVDRAVYDDDPLRPVALRLQRRGGGGVLVPVDAVEGVCPLRRILYLERKPSPAARAVRRLVPLAPVAERAAHAVAAAVVTLVRFAAPRLARAGRECAAGVRRQWPAVRRGLGLAVEGAVVFTLGLAAVAVAGSIRGARAVRHGILAARRLAPHGARIAEGSFALARRALR